MMTFNETHMPPSSLDAEEALLGAMLSSPAAIQSAEDEGVVAESFYRPSHRLIFEAIHAVRDSNLEVDELSVVQQLRATAVPVRKGEDERTALVEVGGAAAVLTLVERCPVVSNAKAYAAEVVNVATKRRLVEIGHAVAGVGYDTTITAPDGVRQAEEQLLELVTQTGKQHQRGDVIDTQQSIATWGELYARRSDPDLLEQDTLSWGKPVLDERLGRMQGGDVFVPAGWTKHGKTWFVMDVAEAVMRQGARVLIDSGEMRDTQLVDRWMAMGGHNLSALEEGRIPWSVLSERRKIIASWDRRTLTGRMTIERLRSQVSRAKLEGRPYRLVIVDHLGLVRPGPGQGRQGRREFVEDVCAELKAMAEEYHFTLLLVSQLSRPAPVKDAHERYLRPPIASDLKEASGIEQIATSVIFVYRRMDKNNGKFDGQSAYLLFPFHRSRPTPEPVTCEFTLPMRPGQSSGSAYRFEAVTIAVSEPPAAVQEVKATLEGTFGPLTIVKADDPDDGIPF